MDFHDPTGFDIEAIEPNADELLQGQYPGPAVPVRITGPLYVHELPARVTHTRNINLSTTVVEQIANEDPRRKYVTVLPQYQDVYLGHNKQAVADGVSAILPAGQLVTLAADQPLYARQASSTPATSRGITWNQGAPAAGAECSITVPNGSTWQLQSMQFSLTTSATVANRRPSVAVQTSAGATYAQMMAAVDQAASTTVTYNPAVGQSDPGVVRNGLYTMPMPPITLNAGYKIVTITSGLQPGDQYSAQYLRVLEQLTPNAVLSYWLGDWAD